MTSFRTTITIALTLATASGVAHADKKKKAPSLAAQVDAQLYSILTFDEDATAKVRFSFNLHRPSVVPFEEAGSDDFEIGFFVIKGKATAALAADGKSVFYAADLGWSEPCGDESCPRVPRPDGFYHVTALLDGTAPWTAATWHVAAPVTADEQKDAMKRGASPRPVARRIAKGAEPVVAVFEASIGDPRALARTVSARTDAVLYGSELKERYVGGAKVAATLAKWNLAFKVRDGIDAGVTSSGTTAWVAANLDATSVKRKGAKPTPYRALFLYENHVGTWQLVSAHFSFVDE